MFENLGITASHSDNNLRIHIQWRWIESNNEIRPSCSVFCCPIPEQQLLNQMIFRQEDIINYINSHIVDTSSSKDRIKNIEEFYRHSTERNMNCSLHQYTLMGDIVKHIDLQYSKSDADKVFFICVYGERSFITRVVSVVPVDSGIAYELKQNNSLKSKILRRNTLSINFENTSNRRMVIVTKYNGEDVYSIVPFGENRYYFPTEVKKEDIISAQYMSSLIGY